MRPMNRQFRKDNASNAVYEDADKNKYNGAKELLNALVDMVQRKNNAKAVMVVRDTNTNIKYTAFVVPAHPSIVSNYETYRENSDLGYYEVCVGGKMIAIQCRNFIIDKKTNLALCIFGQMKPVKEDIYVVGKKNEPFTISSRSHYDFMDAGLYADDACIVNMCQDFIKNVEEFNRLAG